MDYWCMYCGLGIQGQPHWETLRDDGEEVSMPFCNEGCATAYIEEMNEEPEQRTYPEVNHG